METRIKNFETLFVFMCCIGKKAFIPCEATQSSGSTKVSVFFEIHNAQRIKMQSIDRF